MFGVSEGTSQGIYLYPPTILFAVYYLESVFVHEDSSFIRFSLTVRAKSCRLELLRSQRGLSVSWISCHPVASFGDFLSFIETKHLTDFNSI